MPYESRSRESRVEKFLTPRPSTLDFRLTRARFLAEFTLNGQSEIPRSARNDREVCATSADESHQAGAGARRHEVGVEITKAIQHLDRR
jgi:hypothetical protein